MNSDPSSAVPINLAGGASLLQPMRRGTTIELRDGELLLTPAPGWLGERVVQPPLRLRAGERFVVDASGWVTLQALQASSVVCLAPQAAPTRRWALNWVWRFARIAG